MRIVTGTATMVRFESYKWNEFRFLIIPELFTYMCLCLFMLIT